MANEKSLKFDKEKRMLIVQPDVIDLRDRFYTPSLNPLRQQEIPDPATLNIRDQHSESACTGFALAAVIDRQCQQVAQAGHVSTRMLFEMAKQHDDLPDHLTPGSTIRGALKGFYHNGVCSEKQAPYLRDPNLPPWELDLKSARDARKTTLGAYFRLNHEINDYHDAISAAGAIVASGTIHSGWANPKDGVIEPVNRTEGRHAFAIVGYTNEGFLVQNSWGESWGGFNGLKGVALWTYQDWFESIEDAWVLRLAVSSPTAFDFKFARNHKTFRNAKAAETAFTPRRLDIHGHYLHLDDGRYVGLGRYNQNAASVKATAGLIRKGARTAENAPYRHLLIFAHGALSDKFAIAKRIRAWKTVFKCNGIYPMHIMWETGFNNEVVDVVKDLLFKTRKRMGQDAKHTDARLEEMARPLGHKLWRDLKVSVGMTFAKGSDGRQAITDLLTAAHEKPRLKIHFASTSAGALLLAELADFMADLDLPLETANLMAPACSIAHYQDRIAPHLGKTIKRLRQYNLIDSRECNDTLDIYSKSLLYLVSNALEEKDHSALLGMQNGIKSLADFEKTNNINDWHEVYFAGHDTSITDARSHRDFDQDQKTMNDILAQILGEKPPHDKRFSNVSLSNY